ncbi:FAD-binding oxidoreductase [Oceanobacillus halotolerans]|uniref:FAD-binding oxidoreductase n=1 Tax=Oceanobacillus halotolerans TaxID=2663380 RepID=UPI0013DAAB31|nr:FAD-binding oxidoreductase [Oceanobacillus halotolerans]
MEKKAQAEKSGHIYLPNHEAYHEKRKVWNGWIDRYPSAIFECKSEEDVVSAVKYANEQDLEISIKGGGHHIAGTAVCDGGVMIDMSKMNAVAVDSDRLLVEAEAGATLSDIDEEAQFYGLATPTGTVSETGIAGLALGGGFGYLRGKYGLTCDNIVSVRMVTASGELITVNEAEYPDLFWAIRGGGGNFGVITSFTFQLYPVGPEVFGIDVMYDYNDATEILKELDVYMQDAPDDISINLAILQLPPAPFLPEDLHHKRVITLSGMYIGPLTTEKKETVIQPLRELAVPLMDQTGMVSYIELQKKLDPMVPDHVPMDGTSLFLNELNDALISELLEQIEKSNELPMVMAQLWALHGEMNRVPADETAFAIRGARYLLLIDAEIPTDEPSKCFNWMDQFYEAILPFSYRHSSYLNGVKVDPIITKNTYGNNFEKLKKIKQKYDPKNKFRHNHNIKSE